MPAEIDFFAGRIRSRADPGKRGHGYARRGRCPGVACSACVLVYDSNSGSTRTVGEAMTGRENRKFKRYPMQWKAAVIFGHAEKRPVLHTRTIDLSVAGSAFLSQANDLAGSVVTVLLAQPLPDGKNAPKTVKASAKVVSAVEAMNAEGFRYGLSFLRIPGDDLEVLEKMLNVVASAGRVEMAHVEQAAQAASPGPESGTSPSTAVAGGGRLAQLRQLAQAKLEEEERPDPQEEIDQRVSDALQRAYQYLKDLTEQLNVVKPAYAKGYRIVGVPEFGDLAWEIGRIDFRSREISPTKKLYEQVAMHFRLSGNKQIRVTRENPATDRLRQVLRDNKMEFQESESRNDKGYTDKTTFVLPCEVRASLILEGDFGNGRIVLRTRNVERFGMTEHQLVPEAIAEKSLDELTVYILGETHRIGPLLLRTK